MLLIDLAGRDLQGAPFIARRSPKEGGRILLFSGSLYVLALSGVTMLGAVTPFGGVSFIAAWLLLAYRLAR